MRGFEREMSSDNEVIGILKNVFGDVVVHEQNTEGNQRERERQVSLKVKATVLIPTFGTGGQLYWDSYNRRARDKGGPRKAPGLFAMEEISADVGCVPFFIYTAPLSGRREGATKRVVVLASKSYLGKTIELEEYLYTSLPNLPYGFTDGVLLVLDVPHFIDPHINDSHKTSKGLKGKLVVLFTPAYGIKKEVGIPAQPYLVWWEGSSFRLLEGEWVPYSGVKSVKSNVEAVRSFGNYRFWQLLNELLLRRQTESLLGRYPLGSDGMPPYRIKLHNILKIISEGNDTQVNVSPSTRRLAQKFFSRLLEHNSPKMDGTNVFLVLDLGRYLLRQAYGERTRRFIDNSVTNWTFYVRIPRDLALEFPPLPPVYPS